MVAAQLTRDSSNAACARAMRRGAALPLGRVTCLLLLALAPAPAAASWAAGGDGGRLRGLLCPAMRSRFSCEYLATSGVDAAAMAALSYRPDGAPPDGNATAPWELQPRALLRALARRRVRQVCSPRRPLHIAPRQALRRAMGCVYARAEDMDAPSRPLKPKDECPLAPSTNRGWSRSALLVARPSTLPHGGGGVGAVLCWRADLRAVRLRWRPKTPCTWHVRAARADAPSQKRPPAAALAAACGSSSSWATR